MEISIFKMLVLSAIGVILLVLGYLIKFKQKIHLISGVHKNDERIKDKKGFASFFGGSTLIFGGIVLAGALIMFVVPELGALIELCLLASLLLFLGFVFKKSKKHIER